MGGGGTFDGGGGIARDAVPVGGDVTEVVGGSMVGGGEPFDSVGGVAGEAIESNVGGGREVD